MDGGRALSEGQREKRPTPETAPILGPDAVPVLHDVRLDALISSLPGGQIDVDVPRRSTVVGSARNVDLELVGPTLLSDAVGPPEEGLKIP